MIEYLTYDKYVEMGGTLETAAFNRYSVRAFTKIANATHNRIDSMTSVPDEVKHLCRDLIEYLYYNVRQDKPVVSASQSMGGVSENENYQLKTADNIDNDIDTLIDDYLRSVTDDKGTPLLYRGCL